MTTSTPEKTDGLKALQDAIDKIKENITAAGGVFNIQMAVKKALKYFILSMGFPRDLF